MPNSNNKDIKPKESAEMLYSLSIDTQEQDTFKTVNSAMQSADDNEIGSLIWHLNDGMLLSINEDGRLYQVTRNSFESIAEKLNLPSCDSCQSCQFFITDAEQDDCPAMIDCTINNKSECPVIVEACT